MYSGFMNQFFNLHETEVHHLSAQELQGCNISMKAPADRFGLFLALKDIQPCASNIIRRL